MSDAIAVSTIEPPARSEPANEIALLPPAAIRCRYFKFDGYHVADVIIDISAEGQEAWAEQFPGECRWYAFTPSAAERQPVHQ